jgi:hypothetical protein
VSSPRNPGRRLEGSTPSSHTATTATFTATLTLTNPITSHEGGSGYFELGSCSPAGNEQSVYSYTSTFTEEAAALVPHGTREEGTP